jgi:phosphoglycerate dehydrogenase-like enzyme
MVGYRVAVTGDQASSDGTTIFGDIGLGRLPSFSVIDVPDPVLTPAQLDGFDALLMMGGRGITPASLAGTSLRHIARFGAGYDAIDIEACTHAGVVVTNTPDGVRVPMAHAALAQIFALAHALVPKTRLVQSGRWEERTRWQGRGLHDATVGVVGKGNVGSEIVRLLEALGVHVSDLAELRDLAAVSDYLVITVSGNPGTRHLINADVLARMRPGAFLINLSRGSVVDEAALIASLKEGRLRGAALDVFEHEPLPPDSPLLAMDNVVLTPHSLCWTDGFARSVADSAITAILDVAAGRTPRHAVNPEACKVSS